MWKPEHRRAAGRRGVRYPSDLTDAEWALVEPMIPPAKHGGRPRKVNVREVLNGLFYVLSTGCQWDAVPKDLPPKSTLYDYFDLWVWVARCSGSMTPSIWRCASRLDARAARRRRSSTPRAPRGRKKGGLARSVGL